MRILVRALVMSLALALLACQLQPPSSPVTIGSLGRYDLRGTVSFAERAAQIAPTALTSLATATLLDASNRTLAVARTDAAGAFTLSPGASFVAAAGDVFYLDVYKGTKSDLSGDVARMRTILQWTAAGWASTSGGTVVVTPLTTAVCVLQGLNSGTIAPAATLGTVTGATVTSGNATLNANWSAVHALVRDLLAKDQDPLARISLVSGGYCAMPDRAGPLVVESFQTGSFSNTELDAAGDLVLSGPRPTPCDPASELDYFSAANVAPDAAGSVASDGTYLYVTNWGGYGNHTNNRYKVKKIGSGFNGTIRGAYYDMYAADVPSNLGVTYQDGALYVPIAGQTSQLFRLDLTSGATATVDLPAPLVFRTTGTASGDTNILLTGDGTYLYNLAYGIGGGSSNGFTVQVFDPRQGFQLRRAFTMDTSSYYCDGVLCDGTYLYPVNWAASSGSGQSTVIYQPKIRRYRLSDGVREAEWTFAQSGYVGNYQSIENNAISGAWDPVNKVFWLGNLGNEKIHLMRGGRYLPSGFWQSAVLDAGSATPLYGRLSWSSEAQGTDGVSLQVRAADTLGELVGATWYGPTSTTDGYTVSGTALNPIHAKKRYLQVRATLTSTGLLTTPRLERLSLEVLP